MGKISGDLTDECRIMIYDTDTNALVIDEIKSAGSYEFTGLTSYDKFVTAVRTSDGQGITYGDVTPAAEPPVEAVYEILTGTDDAHIQFTSFNATNTYLKLYRNNGGMYLRFANLPMPQGSSIEYAFLRFRAYDTSGSDGNQNVTIYGENSDNGTTVTSYGDFHGRPVTAGVAWATVATEGAHGAVHDTPSIISIISTIVGRGGWSANNAINILVKTGSDTADRNYGSYETGTLPAAELHVRWVAP